MVARPEVATRTYWLNVNPARMLSTASWRLLIKTYCALDDVVVSAPRFQ